MVTALEFHPSGSQQLLASGGGPNDCTIRFYDLSNPNTKHAMRALSEVLPVNSLAFHPTGDYLLVACDHPTRALLFLSIRTSLRTSHLIHSLYSIDAIHVAYCTVYNTTDVCPLLILSPSELNRAHRSCRVSHIPSESQVPNDEYEYECEYVCCTVHCAVRLYDVASGACFVSHITARESGEAHTAPVLMARWASDGSLFASSSLDGCALRSVSFRSVPFRCIHHVSYRPLLTLLILHIYSSIYTIIYYSHQTLGWTLRTTRALLPAGARRRAGPLRSIHPKLESTLVYITQSQFNIRLMHKWTFGLCFSSLFTNQLYCTVVSFELREGRCGAPLGPACRQLSHLIHRRRRDEHFDGHSMRRSLQSDRRLRYGIKFTVHTQLYTYLVVELSTNIAISEIVYRILEFNCL